jgi:ZIP family zinc transporter
MYMLEGWSLAFVMGLVVGSGLFLGALTAYLSHLTHRLIAAVMGFGGGVLIAALSFALMEEAYHHGGVTSTLIGFLGGGALFSSVNWYLSKRGAKNRKRCGHCQRQPSESEVQGSGLAIAVGAMIDAVPEAIVIGISIIGGVTISKVVLIGFFLANVPQGLSSAAGMKEAGRSAVYIFGVWAGIVLLSGVAALLGFAVFGAFPQKIIAAITALAAGGVMAMLAETMIPEAFEKAQNFIGLITVAGFLAFFILIKLGS